MAKKRKGLCYTMISELEGIIKVGENLYSGKDCECPCHTTGKYNQSSCLGEQLNKIRIEILILIANFKTNDDKTELYEQIEEVFRND